MTSSKGKVWWAFIYKVERTCNEIWKLQYATKPYNDQHLSEMKKNDKRA